jgi:hypothetical protein
MLEKAEAFLAAYEMGPETRVTGNKQPKIKLEHHDF